VDINNKIAVCSRSFSLNPLLREELLSKFKYVKFNDEGVSLSGKNLIEFLDGADGAIVALETINNDILKHLPSLKFIGKYGVGLDKLDFNAMREAGVSLGWTPGVNAQSVAELTLALALNILRGIPESSFLAREGTWRQIKGKQLSSMTYGILGCGHVGKALVKLLKGFGGNIQAYDIECYDDFYAENGVNPVSYEQLLSTSDILSVHVPLNEKTRGMIDESTISTMKQGAFLVNTARGGIVDEIAVLNALDSGQLQGAAFDVLKEEPPVDLAFISHPRTLVTTHIAGSSEEAILAMGRAAIDGLINYYPATQFTKYR